MSRLPDDYLWLYDEPGPLMLTEMLRIFGTQEWPEEHNNPVIMRWAHELRLSEYVADRIPWCGLAMAIVAKRAHKVVPKDPLWALNWREFGVPVTAPMLGDVLVKNRSGGGHVTLYVGEDDTSYHCMGGNQDDEVNISRFSKTLPGGQSWYVRRPYYVNQPANVRPVHLSARGKLITSEE